VASSEMPRSPGHVFYDRLQTELVTAGFEGFVEGLCAPTTPRRGWPSLPPGRYFRMLSSVRSIATAAWSSRASSLRPLFTVEPAAPAVGARMQPNAPRGAHRAELPGGRR
jgi:hypothetical protein